MRSPWPVFGVPKILKMDNGAEFWSLSLRATAGQLNFEIIRMPRGKGHMKGGIERAQGVVNHDFIGFLPGRTFRDVREKGDYNSQKRAAVTFPKLVDLFTKYVVDIMHNKPMASLLGMTPLQKWESLSGCGVEMPPEAKDSTRSCRSPSTARSGRRGSPSSASSTIPTSCRASAGAWGTWARCSW